MAKKNVAPEEDLDTTALEGEEADGPGLSDLDFNVQDEYKAEPLIPKGTYHATVTKVSFVPAQSCIVWDVCFHDNGGSMNDGETPIDGAHGYFRNWLPKPGDESILTKSGKNNKRQSKINMLKDFSERLSIDMATPSIIATSLAEAVWVGLEVDADVDTDEYQGKFRNVVNNLKKSTM